MAGRPRRRARYRMGSRNQRGYARRRRSYLSRVFRKRKGRGRRICPTYGYALSASKVPRRLRKRHLRRLPGVMRWGQQLPTRGRTASRRYLLSTACRSGGRLVSFYNRRSRRRRRR